MKNKTDITHPGNREIKYSSLVSSIETLLNDARAKVVREVNQTIVFTYWHIGQYIVEYEQGGKERAEYGTELLKCLSKDLTKSFGRGYSYRNLKLIKKFYLIFPKWQSMITQSNNSIGQSLIALSSSKKRQTVSAKSQDSFVPTASAQFKNSQLQTAFVKLSWTHFVRLLSVKDEDERNFYLIETAENNWSVRELDRQINSSLFERLLLSKDKKGVKSLAEKGKL